MFALCEVLMMKIRPRNIRRLSNLYKYRARVLAATVLLGASPAWGQAGALDPSFGVGGRVTVDASAQFFDIAEALVIQNDGKLVTGGHIQTLSSQVDSAVLTRHNPDGSLDTGFGQAGMVVTMLGKSHNKISALALQADGKILAGGLLLTRQNYEAMLLRYNHDGSLDPTFGDGNGYVLLNVDSKPFNALVVQNDGKILALTGWPWCYGCSSNDMRLVRFTSSGMLDTSFGTQGIARADFGGEFAFAEAVALQADGKILVAGGDSTYFALARFDADGHLDPGFGTNGLATYSLDPEFYQAFSAVVVQPDGKILAGGSDSRGSFRRFSLLRLLADGSYDRSFGNGPGYVLTQVGEYSEATSMALQADGKIVLAGVGNHYDDFALARFSAQGALDPTFGDNGTVTTDFAGSYDYVSGMVLQSDGKIVVAGHARDSGGDAEIALARYLGD
ncbi:hypothetical protein [Lysobacter sp. CA199]|uniref:hypothetical protein n=1 Tax=Lysobacter sp. CA199 TaxID=3455608 RepID=UPI003F8D184B